ncbi:MAG: hypothetical protein EXS05_04235 [Planctomycetaceae bacterium]|nr:hypothetical protein [Planctomycetaceae bacterium]
MDRPLITLSGNGTPRFPSGRSPAVRIALALALAGSTCAVLPGCQIVIGVMRNIWGDPNQDCDFKKQTNRTLKKECKKLVILSNSTIPAQAEYQALDNDVIGELTRRLRSQEFKVVESHEVTRWMEENSEGVADIPTALGAKFKANFIVLVKFEEFGFREPRSVNMFQGHARGSVFVYEIVKAGALGEKTTSKQIYHHPFDSKFPIHKSIPAEEAGNVDVFRQKYIARLSEELARFFYDHRPGEDF